MLHITSIGETWQPLAAFAAQLEPILGGRVQVNLHAGYAGSRGFHTHWDGHDVYAAQIDGRKKWRLFGFTEEAPLAVPPDAKRGGPINASWEGILGTGHTLYVPRGYWHATQFLDAPSLHLTFAVQHPTGIEFTRWLVERLARDATARKDIPLPLFEMSGSGAVAKEQYLSAFHDLLLRTLSQELMAEYLTEYRATLGKVNHVQLIPSEGSESCALMKQTQ
jgi:ribosomal protein L16 Arg81 hydroxylase